MWSEMDGHECEESGGAHGGREAGPNGGRHSCPPPPPRIESCRPCPGHLQRNCHYARPKPRPARQGTEAHLYAMMPSGRRRRLQMIAAADAPALPSDLCGVLPTTVPSQQHEAHDAMIHPHIRRHSTTGLHSPGFGVDPTGNSCWRLWSSATRFTTCATCSPKYRGQPPRLQALHQEQWALAALRACSSAGGRPLRIVGDRRTAMRPVRRPQGPLMPHQLAVLCPQPPFDRPRETQAASINRFVAALGAHPLEEGGVSGGVQYYTGRPTQLGRPLRMWWAKPPSPRHCVGLPARTCMLPQGKERERAAYFLRPHVHRFLALSTGVVMGLCLPTGGGRGSNDKGRHPLFG